MSTQPSNQGILVSSPMEAIKNVQARLDNPSLKRIRMYDEDNFAN